MLKIRNLELENPYFLAPMAEINDIAFRTLCKKAGAGLCWTGMINPLTQQEIDLEDNPAIQLFSTNEKGIKEFIKKYDSQVSLWDFNLGCPAKNARKLGFGSFMHYKLEDVEKILRAMRESTDKPITVKLRKSRNINKILKITEKYCDAICIHPRTSEQGYSGKADLEYALKIKARTRLPVIYSGDVDENNYKKLEKKFDFLMIGRKAVGNPNIFAKLTNSKLKFDFSDVRKINCTFQGADSCEQLSDFSEHPKNKCLFKPHLLRCGGTCFFDYLKLAQEHKLYFSQIKLQAMNFTKKMKNAKEMRRKLIFAKTTRQIKEIYGI